MKMKSFFVSAIAIIGLLADATAQSIPTYVPTAGLVGWWPFNGNANDESGNGNNGTVNGATLTTDRFGNAGKAYSFDGLSNFIDVPQLNTMPYKPATYSTWINANNYNIINYPLGNGVLLVGRDWSGSYDIGCLMIWNQPSAGINNSILWYIGQTSAIASYTPTLNMCTNITMTMSGTDTIKFYINGTLINSQYFPTNSTVNAPFRFGAGANPNRTSGRFFFEGSLDDIGVWNRALTQAEITALYNAVPSGNISTAAIAPPQLMSYQAVVRKGSNQLLINAPVGMRVSILQGSANGAAVYSEKHSATTNAQGLATLAIGGGTAQSGTFSGINWANGPYFLKVETDPTGGNNYTITATSQLMSVPYALHSATSVNAENGIPTGGTEGQVITMCNGVPIWTNSGQCPARIATLDCGSATNSGNLVVTQPAYASTSVPYTSGNGGVYAAQSVPSTGVTGLTATLSAGTLANGAGSLTFTISGSPSGVGTANFAIQLGGQSCTFSRTVDAFIGGTYSPGTVHCNGTPTVVVDVTNPTTGKIWMDRNLGASRAATSSTDADSYGDLYQWGRRADGHQCRNSATTTTLSSTDQPAHGNFILSPNSPYDWRSPQNDNLWQGVSGVNNPCPVGYRIPSSVEWDSERASWSSQNYLGAFSATLKMPLGGARLYTDGSFVFVDTTGEYCSSTIVGEFADHFYFGGYAGLSYYGRGHGFSVRCIKD